jgi:hypothetical protein
MYVQSASCLKVTLPAFAAAPQAHVLEQLRDSEQFFTESQKILDLGGQHLASSLAELGSRPH